ncbi:MAG TPA: hypothetical protein EYG60_03120 [Campylobacterales bacterium]|nr:hypothetical protein [Campylobacterales bacterium]
MRYLISLLFLLFFGCRNEEFSIYRELQLSSSDEVDSNYTDFLKNLIVEGVSYSDDKLTPDIADGKLFRNKYLSKEENISKYFRYSPNRTFDHRISIYVDLHPGMLRYTKAYTNPEARIAQIVNYGLRIAKLRREKEEAERIARLQRQREEEKDKLPKKYLPPKLPNILVGVETPNVPEL